MISYTLILECVGDDLPEFDVQVGVGLHADLHRAVDIVIIS
jgi:hypothetical protein